MKKLDKITLLLMECNDELEISIDHNGSRVLGSSGQRDKTPKVSGYSKPRITEEELREFISFRVDDEGGKNLLTFLNEYINSADGQIALRVKDLQRNLRKIIIHAETKQVAESLKLKIIQANSLKFKSQAEDALFKKPNPKARCTDCGEFYDRQPEDCMCSKCGGYVRNELRPNVWFECQVCKGTGYDSRFKKVCSSCDKKGWLFHELFKI